MALVKALKEGSIAGAGQKVVNKAAGY